MLTIIYVEALLVDDITAYSAWWRVASSAIFKSLVPDLEAIMVTKRFLSAASIVFALSLLTSTTNDWDRYVALAVSDWSASITVFMRVGLATIGR